MSQLPSSTPQPARRRRVLFAAAALVMVLTAVELVSWAGFLVVDGRPFGWGRLAVERDRLCGEPAVAELDEQAPAFEISEALLGQVIHPYLGYVHDPDSPETRDMVARWRRAMSDQGFFEPRWAAALEPAADDLVIGVFGGSVATIFAMQSELLVEALAGQPALTGRRVVVRNLAMPGYRQPQQLLTLAYFLAQGVRLDVVLNLDGFNDVALPMANNLPQGVNPLYPMDWAQRVRELPDPELRRFAGELEYLRQRRRERASALAASPLRFSLSRNLWWRLEDRRLEARRLALEERLRSRAGAGRDFASHGPHWPDEDENATLGAMVELWRRSSLEMHQLCAAAGIRYLHALQPNQYFPGSKPMGPQEREIAVLAGHPYQPWVERGYPELRVAGARLAADGVAFLDLSMAFSAVEEPLYIDPCCHFSWRGNRILAAALAEAVNASLGPR